jgi:hypothetical protein
MQDRGFYAVRADVEAIRRIERVVSEMKHEELKRWAQDLLSLIKAHTDHDE